MRKLAVLFFVCVFPIFCHSNLNDESKDVLIVGCGRSGTMYMANLLQNSGYDVGHEKLGKHGVISWFMVENLISLTDGLFTVSDKEHPCVYHQVRNPLHVISSWFALMTPIDRYRPDLLFILKHSPEISKEDSPIVFCAKYWYYWNLKAEKR